MINYKTANPERYNLYNFEASFKSFLLAGNKNKDTIKNYLSDFRYFCGFVMGQTSVLDNIDSASLGLSPILTPQLLASYKEFLISSHLPRLTINRRLSTVRKFCTFCISQGWIKENPAKEVGNVASRILDPRSSTAPSTQDPRSMIKDQTSKIQDQSALLDLVFEYENELGNLKDKKNDSKKELGNVNEFLSIISAL